MQLQTKIVTMPSSDTISTLKRGPFILVGVEGEQSFKVHRGQPFESDGELICTVNGPLQEAIVLTAAHCVAVEHPHGECTLEILPLEQAPQREATEELESRWGGFRRDEESPMTIGELRERLEAFDDDTELHFEEMEFYRFKVRGENLVQMEFNTKG